MPTEATLHPNKIPPSSIKCGLLLHDYTDISTPQVFISTVHTFAIVYVEFHLTNNNNHILNNQKSKKQHLKIP